VVASSESSEGDPTKKKKTGEKVRENNEEKDYYTLGFSGILPCGLGGTHRQEKRKVRRDSSTKEG